MEGNNLCRGIFSTEDNLEVNNWINTSQDTSRVLEISLAPYSVSWHGISLALHSISWHGLHGYRKYSSMGSTLNKEISSMRSTLKKEISSMRSVINKLSWMKSVVGKDFKAMTEVMDKEFLAMTEVTEKEFSGMKADIENDFSKVRSDMEKKISRIRSVMEREISRMKSIRAIGHHKRKLNLKEDYKWMKISNRAIGHQKRKIRRAVKHHERNLRLIKNAKRSDDDAKGREMFVEKQDIHKNSNGSGHGTKTLKSAFGLAPFCLPCAGGTDHGSDQLEHQLIKNAKRSDDDVKGREMFVEKQDIHKNSNGSGHGTKTLKSAFGLAPFCLPCAGGTDHGSGQREHQDHSEIYQSTLDTVSNCPSPREYIQKSIEKCADVCGSNMQNENCAYHCMRDSSKTKLVEFCAKPEILFDYCPEYDPVDHTIQKDTATLCNSKFSRNYYNSSDIYFCDSDSCLQLHESRDGPGATTLTTLTTGTTEINGGDTQQVWSAEIWISILISVAVVIFLAIVLISMLRYFRARSQTRRI